MTGLPQKYCLLQKCSKSDPKMIISRLSTRLILNSWYTLYEWWIINKLRLWNNFVRKRKSNSFHLCTLLWNNADQNHIRCLCCKRNFCTISLKKNKTASLRKALRTVQIIPDTFLHSSDNPPPQPHPPCEILLYK